jgi:hypothetical protein
MQIAGCRLKRRAENNLAPDDGNTRKPFRIEEAL